MQASEYDQADAHSARDTKRKKDEDTVNEDDERHGPSKGKSKFGTVKLSEF